jgi:predicted small metal-binding protein
MFRQFFAAALVIVFSFALVTLSFAQEAKTSKAHKEAKHQMKQVELKSVSCDPTCGFKVRSHDEKELISIVKTHAKKAHNMDLTDKQVKDMMKTEKID